MSFRELIQLFERRRAELIDILKTRKEGVDLSRQHQIYGAIKEIELFHETLGYYQDEWLKDDEPKNQVFEAADKRPLFRRMKDSIRDKMID